MTDRMVHYKQGLTLFGQQKHEEAVAEYRKALELSPDWTDCLHAVAMALSELGRHDEAIETGQRIVELDADDAFAHTSLSMFYMRKGLIPEAEAEGAKARMVAWRQELKTNPNAPPPADAGGMKVV